MTEFHRNDRYWASWEASGNALNNIAAKDPAELTRDDAMTWALEHPIYVLTLSHGASRPS